MKAGSETRVVDAQFIAGAVDDASLPPPTTVEIAFAGRSNVGKSSLLNVTMQRNGLARTSKTPGCTRQINVYEVRCQDGLVVRFIDLPGYGWAQRSKAEKVKWQQMIESYLKKRASLRAVVVIVDVRRGVEDEERQLVDFLHQPREVSSAKPVSVILVATKVDKLAGAARKPALEAVKKGAGVKPVGFSGETGEGGEELWERIRAAVL